MARRKDGGTPAQLFGQDTATGPRTRYAATIRGLRGQGSTPIYVKLQNEANFLEYWSIWIGLRDR